MKWKVRDVENRMERLMYIYWSFYKDNREILEEVIF